jgi:hypothetical protein
MNDPIRELKIRAEFLHRQLNRSEPAAFVRLRTLPPFRACSDQELESVGPSVRRRDCLSVLARELGFLGWQHAKQIITNASEGADFGTCLYPTRCCGYVNLWYARYFDADIARRVAGGYLLAYRRQFFVVERPFIEDLGMDPDDRDWRRLGFDWVYPRNTTARTRLYGSLVSSMPREGQR